MYLTGKQTTLLGQIMQTLAEPHEETEIREIMGDLVMQLLGAQYYASFVWQPGSQSFAQPIQINMDPMNLRAYESYYQFHDPITPLMQRYQVAVRATDVLPIEELKKTEFFNDFLNKDGLYWGVNLYAYRGDASLGDLVIYRAKGREDFSHQDMACLNIIAPVFTAALSRLETEESTKTAWVGHDEVELRRFLTGRCQLSQREADVVLLCLNGCSDKYIARQLNIGFTTVRYHLGHAFEKLGVQGRNKLPAHIVQLLHQA